MDTPTPQPDKPQAEVGPPMQLVSATPNLGHQRSNKRWRTHPSKKLLALKEVALELFRTYFREVENAARAGAAKLGIEYLGIPEDTVQGLAAVAATKAAHVWHQRVKKVRKAARKRHRLARRINFGLISGNRNRSTHSKG